MGEKMLVPVVIGVWTLAVGYSLYKFLCRDISRAAAAAFRR